MSIRDFDHDPEALAWARGRIGEAIEACRRREREEAAAFQITQARIWADRAEFLHLVIIGRFPDTDVE